MQKESTKANSRRLVWVYPVDIKNDICTATGLEMTKEMRNLGWTVDLIAIGIQGNHRINGVEVLCFPWPKTRFIRQIVYHVQVILYLLQNWKSTDIVMFNQISAPWIFPLRVLTVFGKKRPALVMDTRTVPMEPMDKATLKDKFRSALYSVINRLANTWADGQTAITKRMADYLRIPASQLWGLWPSGVDVIRFSVAPQKRKWPESDGPVIITYIGALAYGRNLKSLCEAVVQSNQQGMNFGLLLNGEGTEKRDLMAYARQADGSVKIMQDTIPYDQIPGLLAQAHVGALPFPDEDKFRVSSPIKLFEYLGAGMPVLATKIVCHTDILGNENFVFWAEGSDVEAILKALRKVWQDRLKLSLLGEKATRKARARTWAASAEQLHKALNYGLSACRK